VAQQQGACKAATNRTRSEVKVANVLIPIPSRDFDPTEVAVSWSVLRRLGHSVVFATPDGRMGRADDLMLTGQGLDLWGFIPGLRRFTAVGRLMRANAPARAAYAAMEQDAAFKAPLAWRDVRRGNFDGLLLPGGHRARGMRDYLESEIPQKLVSEFFAAGLPVAAICHGVLLAARSRAADGRHSVLFGRRTTALTWALERKGWTAGRIFRFWDPNYYRTYDDGPGKPAGYMSVQQEVTRALARPEDFLDVPADAPTTLARPGAWCATRGTTTAPPLSCATATTCRRVGLAMRARLRDGSPRFSPNAAPDRISQFGHAAG
jgi:putative intracellular protease/amidase